MYIGQQIKVPEKDSHTQAFDFHKEIKQFNGKGKSFQHLISLKLEAHMK